MKFIFTYIFLIFFFFLCEKSSYNKKPNVILIMADDIGYECIGVNGSNSYSTPILDSIASKGIRFTNAFS
jgi:arylsulfatase A